MTDPTAAAATQKLHFYQKGTFTVGNRLVSSAERSVQASIDRDLEAAMGHAEAAKPPPPEPSPQLELGIEEPPQAPPAGAGPGKAA